MQFYFIRHAQSQNNELWAQTGSWDGRNEDPDLTSLGREQAGQLAEFLGQPGAPVPDRIWAWDAQNLGGFGLTHLYCSLMVRSVATGTVVARALDLPLVAWQDVHEVGGIHHRDWESGESTGLPGKNRAYFESHYPDLLLPEGLGEEGWWNRPHEAREERPPRARRFWNELLQRHGSTDDRVAVISHGGFYGHLMRALLDLPDGHWFSLNNVGITRLDLVEVEEYGQVLTVHYMNRVDFLPRELVT
jgi:2,3-bisphosphoglycerate-dependent phosphoglycerate mutase